MCFLGADLGLIPLQGTVICGMNIKKDLPWTNENPQTPGLLTGVSAWPRSNMSYLRRPLSTVRLACSPSDDQCSRRSENVSGSSPRLSPAGANHNRFQQSWVFEFHSGALQHMVRKAIFAIGERQGGDIPEVRPHHLENLVTFLKSVTNAGVVSGIGIACCQG